MRHALPNAVAPTIQAIGLSLLYLAGGIVVVEVVFDYPGIGQGLFNAVLDKDIPTIQFIVMLLAAFYVFMNIATDVVALIASPRRRVPDDGVRPRPRPGRRPPSGSAVRVAPHTRPRRAHAVGEIGLVLTLVVVAIAVIGPFVEPTTRTPSVMCPVRRPVVGGQLGGDMLGRDVLSRVLGVAGSC